MSCSASSYLIGVAFSPNVELFWLSQDGTFRIHSNDLRIDGNVLVLMHLLVPNKYM